MSRWTHVTGAIRFDGVAHVPTYRQTGLATLKSILGKTVTYDSPKEDWLKCSVPCGSKGSIQYHIHEYDTGLPWVIVAIWGDLRDYDNIQAIADWFSKICHEHPLVRQGVLEIQCGDQTRVVQFTHDDVPQKSA